MREITTARPTQRHASLQMEGFYHDVVAGLQASPKYLPSKYFYDRRGSVLFEQICQLDEYYLTRTELAIMRNRAARIAEHLGPEVMLIEPGSGSSLKTRLLLENLDRPAAYVPIDISGRHLIASAERLAEAFPHIEILPVVGDFTKRIQMPTPARHPRRRVVYFPGSTIGNFNHREAIELLRRLASMTASDGGILLGYDLRKEPDIIRAAYNDSKGVTAEFNLNLLRRINSELGADFELNQFEHYANYSERKGRIEMLLVSLREQDVHLGDHVFHFDEDEAILTEYSHKYCLPQMAALASHAGLSVMRTWTDPRRWFAVSYLSV